MRWLPQRSNGLWLPWIRIRSRLMPATFVAFDVLWVNGQSFENQPLIERRKTLDAIPGAYQTKGVFVPPYWDCPKEKVQELLELMRTSLAEGIIVKDLDARYKAGRNHTWMKVKAWEEVTADVQNMEVTPNLGFVVYVDTPKGYRQKVVVNDTALQGRICAWKRGGKSLAWIADRLNSESVRTKKDRSWTKRQVFRVVHNPLYRGALHWEDVVVTETHPAIVKWTPRARRGSARAN